MRRTLAMSVGVVVALLASRGGTAATISFSDLGAFHEVFDDWAAATTFKTGDPASFTTLWDSSENGWRATGIGLNWWSSPADQARLTGLDFTGDSDLGLAISNDNEHDWLFQLHFNVGYTDLGETDYYVQNTWTSISSGQTQTITVDFSHAQVWGGGHSGDWLDIAGLGVDLSHLTGVGVQVGGNLPVDGVNDRTAEYALSPVPEPVTMGLLGLGLCGLAGLASRKKKG